MNKTQDEQGSIRTNLIAGSVIAVILTCGVGVWAATTELSGAVIAGGAVVVESNVKKVQHLSGGIVAELHVREGRHVQAGDVVVRLDDTIMRANLAIVVKGIDEMTARKARLESERDSAEAITFPAVLLERIGERDVSNAVQSERKLFDLRRNARAGQKLQLRQRILQLLEEIAGQVALQEAKAEEITLIKRELDGVRELWGKKLVQMNRLTALEREAVRLTGERAQSLSTTAQARGKVAEIEQQIIQIDQDLSSEVARELREIDAKLGEFIERKVAAEDQLKRIEIRAPQDGTVHQLAHHTVGGVVGPGEQIMLIVPESEKLAIDARVPPQEIDQLSIGQTTALRFSAFNQRTTPEISGSISRISADVSVDQRTGMSFYTIRVNISPEEIARLGEVKLVPGMPVEVFAKTYDRSVLSYLAKPLQDQISRAFRER